MWCDQSKYIQHCLRENGCYGADGRVSLRKAYTPPSINEKLGEEEGTSKENNDAVAVCRKCIGQMMWLATRTWPDIAACLRILASLMVRRPMDVKSHLVNLWRCLWTTIDYAMCTLPPPKPSSSILKTEQTSVDRSCARDGPQTWSSSLGVQTCQLTRSQTMHHSYFGSLDNKHWQRFQHLRPQWSRCQRLWCAFFPCPPDSADVALITITEYDDDDDDDDNDDDDDDGQCSYE